MDGSIGHWYGYGWMTDRGIVQPAMWRTLLTKPYPGESPPLPRVIAHRRWIEAPQVHTCRFLASPVLRAGHRAATKVIIPNETRSSGGDAIPRPFAAATPPL
ncbi:MAG: hypothetical protein KatS3mg058_2711 [Roseiflexus sp.]|nr:MAG: hypothetical protein KatS3mg058_2711 [Roseiflexus sp.]